MLRRLIPTISLLVACCAAEADPGYYVVTVYDNYEVRTLDFRYWTVKFPNRPEVRWPEVGFGYGISTRWYTELYASFIGSSQMATKLNTWNWQNDVLLTQGEYPLDVAIHTNLTRYANTEEGYAVELGPVLQTDVERTQLNANVFFERAYGGSAIAGGRCSTSELRASANSAAGTTGHRTSNSRTVPDRPCSARWPWASASHCSTRRRTCSARSTAARATCSRCAFNWRSDLAEQLPAVDRDGLSGDPACMR
jgi:hypothetical protein